MDTHDATAWLSVVPFANVDVRPSWLPRRTGFRLPEFNLRTYVTPKGDGRGDPEGREPVCYYSRGLDVQASRSRQLGR